MEKNFEIIRKTRQYLVTIIDELTIEQLNTIPEGFNNNIVWNLGHVIAAQQGVCYIRGTLPMLIDQELFNKYKPESRPLQPVTEAEVQALKELLFTTIDSLEQDLQTGKFARYASWKTRYGVEINSIEDAINFLSFHDGLHIGYIMALRRSIN